MENVKYNTYTMPTLITKINMKYKSKITQCALKSMILESFIIFFFVCVNQQDSFMAIELCNPGHKTCKKNVDHVIPYFSSIFSIIVFKIFFCTCSNLTSSSRYEQCTYKNSSYYLVFGICLL